jgi:hypothetical protein
MAKELIPKETIEQKIFLIRGQKVMFDRDLARLYGITTFNLNKAVTRNIDRFPEDFMFKLSKREFQNLIFHFGISSWGGTRKSPRVFTEHGILMLSSVLRSKRAVYVNIQIMRAFVRLNKMVKSHRELLSKIKEMEEKYDSQFKVVFDTIRQLMAPSLPKANRIITGFKPDNK